MMLSKITAICDFMLHRHLNHQRFTPAAIDGVIARGRWQDWQAVKATCWQLAAMIFERVCDMKTDCSADFSNRPKLLKEDPGVDL